MERIRQIDMIKGIAIILMVIGHCEVPWKRYIYLFHMAVFIIASGYCFRDNHVKDFKHFVQFVIKKIRSLWLPYVLSTSFYWIGNNVFIDLNFYADSAVVSGLEIEMPLAVSSYMTVGQILVKIIKAMFFGTFTYMGSSMWFLKVLFMISCMYGLVSYLAGRYVRSEKMYMGVHGCVAVMLLVFGYYLSSIRQVIYGAEIACSCYLLFFLGVVFKRYLKDTWIDELKVFIFPITAIGLFILNNYHAVELSENQYGNPVFLIVVSLAGWFMLWAVACILSGCHPVEKCICFIGCHTLEILVLHVFCFKFVNLVLVKYMGLPEYMTAAFPVLNLQGGWWLLFTVVGVGLPVFIGCLFDNLKSKFFMKG